MVPRYLGRSVLWCCGAVALTPPLPTAQHVSLLGLGNAASHPAVAVAVAVAGLAWSGEGHRRLLARKAWKAVIGNKTMMIFFFLLLVCR